MAVVPDMGGPAPWRSGRPSGAVVCDRFRRSARFSKRPAALSDRERRRCRPRRSTAREILGKMIFLHRCDHADVTITSKGSEGDGRNGSVEGGNRIGGLASRQYRIDRGGSVAGPVRVFCKGVASVLRTRGAVGVVKQLNLRVIMRQNSVCRAATAPAPPLPPRRPCPFARDRPGPAPGPRSRPSGCHCRWRSRPW